LFLFLVASGALLLRSVDSSPTGLNPIYLLINIYKQTFYLYLYTYKYFLPLGAPCFVQEG